MDTFTSGTYTINASLNERTIYLKIIDLLQYLSYEGNIELKELKLPITLKDAYILITKCLSNTDDHLVKFSKNTNLLRLDFTAKVGGYMNISFEVMLRECIIGDDARMSMKLIEIEKKNSLEHAELKEQLRHIQSVFMAKTRALEDTIIQQQKMIELFGNINIDIHGNTRDKFPKLNSEIIEFNTANEINKFSLFYNCKKVLINYIIETLEGYNNNNVEEIYVTITKSLKGIHNMPNLKIINIKIDPRNNIQYEQSILQHLKEYDNNITQIIITNPQKPDPTEVQKYCKEKGIELIIQ
jgi:hypothetical protein